MFAIAFASCEGPIGPIGPAGTDGTNGTNGTNGTEGTDGAVNVENLSITVSPSQWTFDATSDIWYYRYNTDVDINSLVYGYVMSGNGHQALPYLTITDYKSEQYTFATDLFETPPYVELQYSNLDDFSAKPTGDTYFYLIVVPPSSNKSNLDYSDYDAVMDFYNLDK